MVGVVEPQDTRDRSRSGHLLGAAGGLALALVVVGLVTQEQALRDQMVRDASTDFAWGIVGLYVLAGLLVGHGASGGSDTVAADRCRGGPAVLPGRVDALRVRHCAAPASV